MNPITLYGIPNCDSVKKARQWLDSAGMPYQFHDYKKQGVPAAALTQWVEKKGLATVLNRQGTTFRKLSDAEKAAAEKAASAIALMGEQPSLIKRPILEAGAVLLVGFKPDEWQEALKN